MLLLEKLAVQFGTQYKPVAVLAEKDLLLRTSEPLETAASANGAQSVTAEVKLAAERLHEVVTRNDVEELR